MTIDLAGNLHRPAGTPSGGQFTAKTNRAPAGTLAETVGAPGDAQRDQFDADFADEIARDREYVESLLEREPERAHPVPSVAFGTGPAPF